MRLSRLLPLALLPPLSAQAPAPDGGERPASASALWWGDLDGDARPDAFVTQPDGGARLMLNQGDGAFEDATERLGLGALRGHHMAAFADATGDGRTDLFLPAWRGPSRLMVQQPDGTLLDEAEARGLPVHAEPLDARWLDVDGDGALDLWLTTLHDDLVYRNDGRGRFARLELSMVPRRVEVVERPAEVERARALRGVGPVGGGGGTYAPGPDTQPVCALGVVDQANPANCLPASSVPTVGHLLAVGSSAHVPNLNADLLDGLDSSVFSQFGKLVDAAELADGAVTTTKLGDKAVTGVKLAAGAVAAVHLAPGAVDSGAIADGAVTAVDLAAGSVTSGKLSPGAVDSTAIGVGAVGSVHVADGSLTGSDLADNAVAAHHVVDGSLTNADVNGAAGIAGTKIVPDFGSQDIVTLGEATIGSGTVSPFKVKSLGRLDNHAYLAVEGATDFDGVLSADWIGLELGVAGVSVGSTIGDNYGVLGHSNHVGVRGEHSLSPTVDYAELGRAGTGLVASGSVLAADLLGNVRIEATNSNNALEVTSQGTGTGLFVEGVGGPTAELVSSASDIAVSIQQNGSGLALEVVSADDGVYVEADSGQPAVEVIQRGPGRGLQVDAQAGVGLAVNASTPLPGARFANDSGPALYTISATGPGLQANNASNVGNIIEASNDADLEFRVDSSGDVYCDVAFNGGGADYAEWLEQLDPAEALEPGDVLGVHGGRVTHRTAAADHVLVVSTNPVLVGNTLGAEHGDREGHVIVAFLGQAPVRVRGGCAVGDLLLPSGREDGTALAVAPDELEPADLARVIGTAWEAAAGPGEAQVNAAIGLSPARAGAALHGRLARALARSQARVDELEDALAALLARVEALEAR